MMAIVTEVFDDDEIDDGDVDGCGEEPPNGGDSSVGDVVEQDEEEREFGQLMGFNEVMKVVEEKGEELPARRGRD